MSLVGDLVGGWADRILSVFGRKVARELEAQDKREVAAETLTTDVTADNLRFAEEAAQREVTTGKPRPL